MPINLSDLDDVLVDSPAEDVVSKKSKNEPGWILSRLSNMSEGNRNEGFTSYAGLYSSRGFTAEETYVLLVEIAKKHNFPEEELRRVVDGVYRRYPNKQQFVEKESHFGTCQVVEGFQPLKSLNLCEDEVWVPIVDGMIFEKQFHLLHGQKNSLKSWLGGYIACCVSIGAPCFNRPAQQGVVVYAYGEGSMKKRLRRISKALGCEENVNLYPYQLRADLTNDASMADFKGHIPLGTKLIIIDNYEKYWMSDVDDKVVDRALRFIGDLKEKVAVILIQHDVKRAEV